MYSNILIQDTDSHLLKFNIDHIHHIHHIDHKADFVLNTDYTLHFELGSKCYFMWLYFLSCLGLGCGVGLGPTHQHSGTTHRLHSVRTEAGYHLCLPGASQKFPRNRSSQ